MSNYKPPFLSTINNIDINNIDNNEKHEIDDYNYNNQDTNTNTNTNNNTNTNTNNTNTNTNTNTPSSTSSYLTFNNLSSSPASTPLLPKHKNNSLTSSPSLNNKKSKFTSLDDFTIVDWSRDQDLTHYSKLKLENIKLSYINKLFNFIYKGGSWFLLAIIGIFVGLLSSFIDIVWTWLDSLRLGYCDDNLFLNQAICCGIPSINSHAELELVGCEHWISWSKYYGILDKFQCFLWDCYTLEYFIYVLSGVLLSLLGTYFVCTFAIYSKASGIPELKSVLNGTVIKHFLGGWTLLIKFTGICIVIASGLVLGKEGPMIHIACCVGNILCRFFPKFKSNEANKREILSASSAAGVAVAFGAPIGGVLFSFEELSSYFPHRTLWRSFFCSVVAVITVSFINPFQTGKLVLFQISFSTTWMGVEMIAFAFIGLLGGLLGALFIKINIWRSKILDGYTSIWMPYVEIGLLSFITNIVRFPIAPLKTNLYELLTALLFECHHALAPQYICHFSRERVVLILLVSGAILFLCCAFTYNSWIPGGIFMPSLLIGACFGRAVGVIVAMMHHNYPQLFPQCDDPSNCITPGIYALVGAASLLSGITRMTVSLVVIMFELTGGLQYVLPIVVGVITARWVGNAFSSSIFDQYISMYGYPYLDHKINIPSSELKAKDVMTATPVVLTMSTTVGAIKEILEESQHTGYPVVTSLEEMIVIGYTRRIEIKYMLQKACEEHNITINTRCYFAVDSTLPKNVPRIDLAPCLDPSPIQIVEDMSLERSFHMFRTLGLGYCLVTRFGKLMGVLTKNDLLRTFSSI